jgi:methionyl-tRNA formyltransferase
MKFVILTNYNSTFGKKLIQQLENSNFPVEAVIVVKQNYKYHVQLFNYVSKRVGILEALVFSVKMVWEGLTSKDKEQINYTDFATKMIYTNGTNSLETETKLKELNPDVLILAQTGIVRKNILSIPRLGTLNSHPAILPYYRGIDCHQWAILHNDYSKIGSTVHWVNEGVDTGNIISTKQYTITKTESIKDLEKNLYSLCIVNMQEVLLRLSVGDQMIGAKQKREDGKQFYKMSLKLERQVKIKLSKFQSGVN